MIENTKNEKHIQVVFKDESSVTIKVKHLESSIVRKMLRSERKNISKIVGGDSSCNIDWFFDERLKEKLEKR
jgi:hypothetical protein